MVLEFDCFLAERRCLGSPATASAHQPPLQTELCEYLEVEHSPMVQVGASKTLNHHTTSFSAAYCQMAAIQTETSHSEGVPQTISMGNFGGKGLSCFWD